MKIKNKNERYDLRVSFGDTFKADNRIFSISSRTNRMVRNFISRKVNVLKIYKTLIRPHIEYCTQNLAPLSLHGNWSIEIRGHTKKRDKN